MARVILRDGRVAEFREAMRTDSDREKLRQLFAAGSDESRYLRFFRVVRTVQTSDIDNMLRSDGVDQFTLICTSEGRSLGVGSYTRSGSDVAEVAFFVADKDQGRGIGTLLLEHLASVAFDYGFRRFEAGVLMENRRMQRVFASSGYEVTTHETSGIVRMELPLYESERTRSLMELREKHAVAASLASFLQPRSIAVVGASRHPEGLGQMIFRHVVQGAFTGTVYPVNPNADSVAAVKAYASVRDVPETVDLAVLVVPADRVMEAAEDCISAGVHAVVTVSSGFAEQGQTGVELQQRLLTRLREAGCRLLGPNSLGIVNTSPVIRMNASLVPKFPTAGGLAIASQSGALGIAILEYATRSGIGVSSFVSTGNRADISSNDLLQYWEDDVGARIVALYLESFGNPRTFSRIARRLTRRKPIVAVKSARSSASLQVSDMYRTVLYADDGVVDALFRQTGIIRVDTLPELFDVAALLSAMPLPAGKRVAVVTNSAGGAVMAVDALEKYGLTFVSPVLDLGSEAFAEGYGSVLRQVLRDPAIDAVLVVFVPIGVSDNEGVKQAIAGAIQDAADEGVQKPVVANLLTTADSLVHIATAGSVRLPVFPFPEQAARALGHIVGYAEYVRQPVGRMPDLEGIDMEAARTALDAVMSAHDEPLGAIELSQATIIDVLRALHIPVGAEPDSLPVLSVVASLDPLFGPIIQLADELKPAGPWRSERIAPLTDMDCNAMIRGLGREHARQAWHADIVDLLLRVSRLVDEVHAVAGLKLPILEIPGANGPSLCVDTRLATMQIHPVALADQYRR